MKKHFFRDQKSFTLLETIVAIYVLLTGIVGVMSLSQQNLQSVSVFRNQLIAANLAQEGIELVRNQRDTNYLRCLSGMPDPKCAYGIDDENINNDESLTECKTANGCYPKIDSNTKSLTFIGCASAAPGTCQIIKKDTNGFYGYDAGSATPFDRRVTITEVGDYLRSVGGNLHDWQVTSVVTWTDRFVTRNVTVKAYFSPWLR